MNDQFRHAFISKNRYKSAEAEQNDKIQGTQKSKVVIGDVAVCYPDGAMIADKRL